MISSEVQRTLVKSPPELWAELSDPAALARHLGELGEIRITRTEPEKLVEWEAEGTKGTVAMKASGWGTKVTLSVSRELPASEPSEPEASSIDVRTAVTEPSSTSDAAGGLEAWASQEAEQSDQPRATAAERFAHDDPEPLLRSHLVSDHETEGAGLDEEDLVDAGPGSSTESPEPTEPRRGLLARLFGRRRKRVEPIALEPALDGAPKDDPSPQLSISAQAVPEVLETPEPPRTAEEPLSAKAEAIEDSRPASMEPDISGPNDELAAHGSPAAAAEQTPPEPVQDLAVELKQAEEAASEEVTAVLTGMLDRLGAAHHRPFSRA